MEKNPQTQPKPQGNQQQRAPQPKQPQGVKPAQSQPKRTPQKPVKPKSKSKGPEIYGYRPPKWAKDYEYVRKNKGKGGPASSKTWLLMNIDRLLKKHSI